MMTFYDGAADGQSDSHAIVLGCVKCIKHSIHGLRVETNPGILHGQAHAIVFVDAVLMINCLGRSSIARIASDAFRSRFRITC